MHFRQFFLIFSMLSLVLVGKLTFAQTLSEVNFEEEIFEQILDALEQEVDLSEFTETLRYYFTHPIDLNKANERELASLLFLSPLQIANLLRHREETGRFLSVLELQAVEGLDLQTIEKLLPFIQVSSQSSLKSFALVQLTKESDQQFMLRYARTLERQQGYVIRDTSRSRYLGNADRYMVRYRLNYKDQIRLAINMEKDAGEPFFREKQQWGFDHYGFSLQIKGKSLVKDLIIGDYTMQVGQGLMLWNGLSFGKGAIITSSARQGLGLKSYTSMNEFGFMRGASSRLALTRQIDVTPFLSWRKLSGSLTHSDEATFINSISASGLHRTPNELDNKGRINQYTYGFDMTYRHNRLKLGLASAHIRYHWDFAPQTSLRNLDNFTGKSVANLGFNYQTTIQNAYFFGEIAYQWQGAWATLNGIILSLNPQFSIFVNYRNYHRLYYAPFGQALSEGSTVANENGIYAGLSYRLGRQIEWTSYVDQFRFPWLRYGVDAPSRGIDVFSQFSYIWYKIGKLSFRYRHRTKQENSDLQTAEHVLTDWLKDQIRLDFQYKLSKVWEIRSRVEAIFFAKEAQDDFGALAYQDVFWNPRDFPLQFNLRLAIFHTDSYDSRLYAYENDVLYASSFPLYYGKGMRSYTNIRYRINRKFDSWLRFSLTHYADTEAVGSGLDKSEGPFRSDLKIQLRYRW